MRRIFWTVLVAALMMVSCKKEQEASKTNAELIVGTWSFATMKIDKLVNGVVVASRNEETFEGQTISFSSDGNSSSRGDTIKYKLNGNQLIWQYDAQDADTTEIIILTETELEIYHVESEFWNGNDTILAQTMRFIK